jgi:hypothetical protein
VFLESFVGMQMRRGLVVGVPVAQAPQQSSQAPHLLYDAGDRDPVLAVVAG